MAMKLKIGIDIHGVIDECPETFSELTRLLVDGGHEVHILTGPRNGVALQKELTRLGIVYTHIFSIQSHHEALGTEMTYDEKGHPWMEDLSWDRSKGDYCVKHGIHIHFDDSDVYSYHFKTPYARFLSKNKRKYYGVNST